MRLRNICRTLTQIKAFRQWLPQPASAIRPDDGAKPLGKRILPAFHSAFFYKPADLPC